jgi:hypothetical protein
MFPNLCGRCRFVFAIALLVFGLLEDKSVAQIYLSNDSSQGDVSKFDQTSGAGITTPLVSGLAYPEGLAVAGNTLYISEGAGGRVRTYDATTGVVTNSNFITGLSNPENILLNGPDLYVISRGSGMVGLYNSSTGARLLPRSSAIRILHSVSPSALTFFMSAMATVPSAPTILPPVQRLTLL